jgi:AraC-like DNA-binding protein
VETGASQNRLLRFSTADLPPLERLPIWLEVFGRQCVQVEMVQRSDLPLETYATLLALPGLRAAWCLAGTPASWRRTPEIVRDGNDDFALLMPLSGAMASSQLGREIQLNKGAGVGILNNEPASIEFDKINFVSAVIPRSALSPLVRDLEDASIRLVPAGANALRLLRGYLARLRANTDTLDPSLCHLAVTHVYDLVALAIGATRDGAQIALARGARVARLQAIKDDFAANPSFTLATLAARQGVSPRYVQVLFESDGTTFTAYALEQRLLSTYRMLRNPRLASQTIGALAFEAGFGDLSHFNRSFRRRFGASPSEIRAAARGAAS